MEFFFRSAEAKPAVLPFSPIRPSPRRCAPRCVRSLSEDAAGFARRAAIARLVAVSH
jgi:hypothetical protein